MEKEVNKEKPKEPTFTKASEDKEKKEEGLEEIKKKLEECQKLKNEYLAGWQREKADFLNYKRDEWERLEEILKFAGEGLILKILPILDNFEIVVKKLPDNLINNENVKGILQIKSQLQNFLKSQGVEEIESLGKKFDPHLHEVVGEVASSEALAKENKKTESGTIIEEIQKGYKINGRLLRPAKVKVVK